MVSPTAATTADGLLSGVFFASLAGLSCRGVEWPVPPCPLGTLIAEKPVGAELTAVKPPELTAVKPDTDRRGACCSGAFGRVGPSCNVAFRAKDAFTAGDALAAFSGLKVAFAGVGTGEGVYGPPFSRSCCWRTLGLFCLSHSSYGWSHFWYEFLSEVESEDMILPLYPKSRPISAQRFPLHTRSNPPFSSTNFFNLYRSRGRLSTLGNRLRLVPVRCLWNLASWSR